MLWGLPPLVLVAIALVVFPSGGTDDSYITYWAARSLARTGEILNYNGVRLEQSSSLLDTLFLAVLVRLTGWPAPLVGHLVAPLGGAATVVATVALARRVESRGALLAGLVAATSAYLAFWTFGGLETTVASAALTGAILTCARLADDIKSGWWAWAGATAVVTATVLVRPEGAFVLGAALAGAIVVEMVQARRRPSEADGYSTPTKGAPRRLLVLLGITMGALGLSMLARLAYFGAPFPNPVGSKTSDLVASEGWLYLAKWWLSRFQVPLLVLAGAGAVLALVRRRGPAASLAISAVVAITGFVLLSGGDWMQAGRFLVPAVPFLSVLAAFAIVAVPWWRVIAVVVVGVQLLGVVDLARHRSTTTPLWTESIFEVAPEVDARFAWFELRNRVHLRNAALFIRAEDVVDQLLLTAETPITISSVQGGLTIYSLFADHPGELRFIDRHNLVSRDFTACEELLEPSFRGLGRKMTYEAWFAHVEDCGVAPPDVVIEYDTLEDHPGLPGRYTVVASVPKVANHADSRLPGIDVGTAQFVAVRNDLLDRLRL